MKDCVVQYLVKMNNTENYALAVVTSLQVTIGLISNAVVIAAISLGQRHNKTPADVMVLNLSCSDLLPCLTFLPWMTFQLIHGIHGEPTYYFIEALFSFLVICSENAVLAVTFDRYIAICYPLRYKSIMSANQNILLTLCIWGIGISSFCWSSDCSLWLFYHYEDCNNFDDVWNYLSSFTKTNLHVKLLVKRQ